MSTFAKPKSKRQNIVKWLRDRGWMVIDRGADTPRYWVMRPLRVTAPNTTVLDERSVCSPNFVSIETSVKILVGNKGFISIAGFFLEDEPAVDKLGYLYKRPQRIDRDLVSLGYRTLYAKTEYDVYLFIRENFSWQWAGNAPKVTNNQLGKNPQPS